jgi:polyvinyl alcohol dehydrogenase (cytochrome)
MRPRYLALVIIAASSTAVRAEPPPPAQVAQGEAVFRRVCAACHLGLAETNGVATADPTPGAGLAAHAVPREFLRQYPPEAILNALTNGKMQAQGAQLSDAERHAVAVFLSNRSFGAHPLDARAEAGTACTDATPMTDPTVGPAWSSWGNGLANTRFQSQKNGGLTAAELPRLKLKWAFGYVNVSSARSQPAVAGGRLFVASESGQVHALNPKTGCTYWSFTAQAGVPTGLSVGLYKGANGQRGYAVYFGDRKANAYAVDAESGRQLWVRKLDEHPSAAITGSLTLFDGRVFVPVQGIGEEGRAGHAGYACCTFRGSVSALDAATGALIWKTYTISESKPRGKGRDGTQLFGPAGGGIWSAPTIDVRRSLVYVATGNAYAEPLEPTTDAVIALDVKTGAIKWSQQALKGDVWAMGCDAHNPNNPVCPQTLGPDFDFSASPALTSVGDRDLLVVPQKSGIAFAFDPAQQGKIVWQYRFGQGSGLGGQWGGAIEGDRAFVGTGDILTKTPGGMHAVNLADGTVAWELPPPTPLCGTRLGCNVGQGGAITAIPGAVLSGSLDGGLRAYSTRSGSLIWMYDTNRPYKTVNGVEAHGGGLDGSGAVVVDGMLYVNSGSGGFVGQPGNVLLAFGLD